MIRVVLPFHLRNLAHHQGEVHLDLPTPVTLGTLLDALEARFPALKGTIRDHDTGKRRPMLRYYACQEDLSFESADSQLPEAVLSGEEPFLIVGAISGG